MHISSTGVQTSMMLLSWNALPQSRGLRESNCRGLLLLANTIMQLVQPELLSSDVTDTLITF